MNNENSLDSFLKAWLKTIVRETMSDELDKRLEDVHKNINELRDVRLQNLQNDLSKLSGIISKKDDEERQRLQKDSWALESYKNQIEKLRIELSDKNKSLEDSQNNYEKLRKEAKDEIERLSYEIDKLKSDNRVIADALSATEKKLNAWTSAADIYSLVRDAITKCPTFRKVVEDYGLDDMSETGLLAYIQAMGKTTNDFVYEIYKTAVDIKKQTRELMTSDESNVYDALNQAYRHIWNIDHDIFILPGGQFVTEIFQKTNFNFSTSAYLPEPRKNGLAYTTGIYVPVLMNKDGTQAQRAYVDAGNR